MAVKKKRKRMSAFEKKFRADMRKLIKLENDVLFNATTLEQRKTFIKNIRDGKSWGVSVKAAGIDMDTALVVYGRNIKTIKYTSLKSVEDVK